MIGVNVSVASKLISSGDRIVGGIVSCTSTVNIADAKLPAMSITAHLTIVIPNVKIELKAGEHLGLPAKLYCLLLVLFSVTAFL